MGVRAGVVMVALVLGAGCGGARATRSTTNGPPTESAERAEGPSAGVHETPSRAEVVASMQGIQELLDACVASPTTVQLRVTYASDGHAIRTELIAGAPPGTPVAECLERAGLQATVPPFARPSFTLSYPFRLRYRR